MLRIIRYQQTNLQPAYAVFAGTVLSSYFLGATPTAACRQLPNLAPHAYLLAAVAASRAPYTAPYTCHASADWTSLLPYQLPDCDQNCRQVSNPLSIGVPFAAQQKYCSTTSVH